MVLKRTRMTVDAGSDGVPLQAFLSSAIEGLSRRKARLLAGQGMVFVDGVKAKKSATVKRGQAIEVLGEIPAKGWRPRPDPSMTLAVVFESARFLAVTKPAGTATVPLSPHETGCLANALAHRYPECVDAGRAPQDAGLLGRLDTGTSGLLLAARSREAFDELWEAQRRSRIVKDYLAICIATRGSGKVVQTELSPPGGEVPRTLGGVPLPPEADERWNRVVLPLAASASDDERVVIAQGKAKFRGRPAKARTDYIVLQESNGLSLVLARIAKGFRHQIRVHLASAGLPLAADPLYGKPHPVVGASFLLHAWRIAPRTPIRGLPQVVVSELPSGWLERFEATR